jgi:hypothetical protein
MNSGQKWNGNERFVEFEWQARNVLDKDKSSLLNNEAYREKWRKLEEFPQKSFDSKITKYFQKKKKLSIFWHFLKTYKGWRCDWESKFLVLWIVKTRCCYVLLDMKREGVGVKFSGFLLISHFNKINFVATTPQNHLLTFAYIYL